MKLGITTHHSSLITKMLLFSVFALGLICFYLCFKSIDVFEKI